MHDFNTWLLITALLSVIMFLLGYIIEKVRRPIKEVRHLATPKEESTIFDKPEVKWNNEEKYLESQKWNDKRT